MLLAIGIALPVGPGILTRNGAVRLSENATLAGVRRLQFLVGKHTGPIPDLLGGRAFQSLSSLDLQAHEYPAPPPPDVFDNPRLSSLEELSLRGYAWDRAAAERLTRAPLWRRVRDLTLGEGILSEEALRVLGDSTAACLRKLSLFQSLPADLSVLCGPVLRTITTLHLTTGLRIDPSFVERLANCEHALGLRSLALQSRSIGDAQVAVLAASPRFKNLCSLDLMYSEVTSVGALALAASPHLDDLARIILFGCSLDDRARTALHDRFGDGVWV